MKRGVEVNKRTLLKIQLYANMSVPRFFHPDLLHTEYSVLCITYVVL
jgi:hypothetical protein